MKIAIVGSSRLTENEAMRAFEEVHHQIKMAKEEGDTIITGDADGIDYIVRCFSVTIPTTVIKALDKEWEGLHGFKSRNTEIAQQADHVISISTGKIKDEGCYHCDKSNHQRTGGCWTKKFAIEKLNKTGETIII